MVSKFFSFLYKICLELFIGRQIHQLDIVYWTKQLISNYLATWCLNLFNQNFQINKHLYILYYSFFETIMVRRDSKIHLGILKGTTKEAKFTSFNFILPKRLYRKNCFALSLLLIVYCKKKVCGSTNITPKVSTQQASNHVKRSVMQVVTLQAI